MKCIDFLLIAIVKICVLKIYHPSFVNMKTIYKYRIRKGSICRNMYQLYHRYFEYSCPTWNLWPVFVTHRLRLMCKGYRFEFVESLFKWIGRYMGHLFSMIMCEIHFIERYFYFLMWYTSRFACKVMSIQMHVI